MSEFWSGIGVTVVAVVLTGMVSRWLLISGPMRRLERLYLETEVLASLPDQSVAAVRLAHQVQVGVLEYVSLERDRNYLVQRRWALTAFGAALLTLTGSLTFFIAAAVADDGANAIWGWIGLGLLLVSGVLIWVLERWTRRLQRVADAAGDDAEAEAQVEVRDLVE